MKTKPAFNFYLLSFVFYLVLALRPSPCALSQVPQGFNYQAIARDGSGNPLPGPINVKIAILSSITPETVIWEEEHPSVPTDAHGLFSIVVGQGNDLPGGLASFSEIDWTVTPKYIRTKINETAMGTTQLWSVPYSKLTDNLSGPVKKLEVNGTTTSDTEPLFQVKNKDNKSVFAVYNDGVSINVGTRTLKGAKGGFSVGGFEAAKDIPGQQYFLADPSGVRVYIDDNNTSKPAKGGFSVGGFDAGKGGANFLDVSYDYSGTIATPVNRILWYPQKNALLAGNIKILSTADVGENSFGAGYQAKAQGNYSQAMGYLPWAEGSNSTAIGNEAHARMANSYAIGDKAEAYAIGSYAIGSVGRDTSTFEPTTQSTTSSGNYSFAIGLGAQATGTASTSLGVNSSSTGAASIALGVSTVAQGEKSTALSAGQALGRYSFAAGFMSKAEGDYSIAIGRGIDKAPKLVVWNHALGYQSIALGYARAYALSSIAIGSATVESTGKYGVGIGNSVTVNAEYSTAIGSVLTANSYNSFVIGKDNVVSGTTGGWLWDEPLFVIGNGTGSSPSNAFTVLKNAKTGIATATPTHMLDLRGQMRITESADYDVWIQGGSVTGSGYTDNRNLALIGFDEDSGDKLFVNFLAEYANGTEIGGPVFMPTVYSTAVTPTYALYIQSDGKIGHTTSSIKYKENVFDLTSYDWLFDLRPVVYNYKNNDPKNIQYGLIAEEVDQVNPLLVIYGTDNKPDGLMYDRLTVPMLKAIQDQQFLIESLNKENQQLKAQNNDLEKRLERIEKMVLDEK